MKKPKDTAKQPPARSKKPLADGELDKVSGGTRLDELVEKAEERTRAAAAAGSPKP